MSPEHCSSLDQADIGSPSHLGSFTPPVISMDVSVVIPCYNEASYLRTSMALLTEVLAQTRWEYELILVDDCSSDDTRAVIEDFCRTTPQCSFIFHDVNNGRGAAFKTGFRQARGTVVGFIDIDLEVGSHYVPLMIRQILCYGYDVATGHRHDDLGAILPAEEQPETAAGSGPTDVRRPPIGPGLPTERPDRGGS